LIAKRILIIGIGNSAVDIADDLVNKGRLEIKAFKIF
jgi:cation diffusion facilitator CzcD-associated flavoprotein CzcO